jgi:hypothetical protein
MPRSRFRRSTRNAMKRAGAAALTIGFASVVLATVLGGLISAVRLFGKGQGRLVALGAGLIPAMPVGWMIGVLPIMAADGLLFGDPEKRSLARRRLGTLFVTLGCAALIGAWCALVFSLCAARVEPGTAVPLLLWAYAVTMAPLAFMAMWQPHDRVQSTPAVWFAVATYLLLLVLHLARQPT